MTTETPPTPGGVAEPGLLGSGSAVVDMDEQAYHKHPALSQSGAKLLLKCPALYRYRQTHPERKQVFDFGTAAHKMVLGVGAPFRVIDFPTWQYKDAKKARDEAYAAGETPLLTHEHATVCAMAEAMRAEPLVHWALSGGRTEISLFWQDRETGVPLRGRADYLWDAAFPKVIVDYKSTVDANPESFAKSAVNYGYHVQDAFYRDAVETLGLAEPDQIHFVLIAQEKEPPYLVSVVELDEPTQRLGRQKMRQAIEIYQRCTELDEWPGYAGEVKTISAPGWALKELEDA